MKLFRKLDVNKIVDSTISGIDKMKMTNEEKADHMAKVADAQTEFVKMTLNAKTPSSKARRMIAVALVSLYILLLLAAVIGYWFDKEYTEFILDIIKSNLSALVLMIMGFYFGGYMASTHLIKSFTETRDKRKQARIDRRHSKQDRE